MSDNEIYSLEHVLMPSIFFWLGSYIPKRKLISTIVRIQVASIMELPTIPDILVAIFFLPASAIGYLLLYILGFHERLGLEKKEILFFAVCFLCGTTFFVSVTLLLYILREYAVMKDFLSLFNVESLSKEIKIVPFLLPAQIIVFITTPIWLGVFWSVIRRREKKLKEELQSINIPRAKEQLRTIREEIAQVERDIDTARDRILGTTYLLEELGKLMPEGQFNQVKILVLDELDNLSVELQKSDIKSVVALVKEDLNELISSLTLLRPPSKKTEREEHHD